MASAPVVAVSTLLDQRGISSFQIALPFVLGAVVCFSIYRLNEARLRGRNEPRAA